MALAPELAGRRAAHAVPDRPGPDRPGPDRHDTDGHDPDGPALRDVLPELREQVRSHRRRRLLVLGTIVLIVVTVFGLVASHVVLVQGQVRLQALQQEAARTKADADRLRLDVAGLEAPDRIVDEATRRLGMTQPDGVTYLTPGAGTPGGVVGTATPTGRAGAPTSKGVTSTTVKGGKAKTPPTTVRVGGKQTGARSGATTTPGHP